MPAICERLVWCFNSYQISLRFTRVTYKKKSFRRYPVYRRITTTPWRRATLATILGKYNTDINAITTLRAILATKKSTKLKYTSNKHISVKVRVIFSLVSSLETCALLFLKSLTEREKAGVQDFTILSSLQQIYRINIQLCRPIHNLHNFCAKILSSQCLQYILYLEFLILENIQ